MSRTFIYNVDQRFFFCLDKLTFDRNVLRQYVPLHKIFTGMQHKLASQFIGKPAQAESVSREFCAHIYKVRRLDFSLLDCC